MYKSIIKPGLFCYAIPITDVPANGSVKPQINFSNDSDFILTEIRSTKQSANGDITVLINVSSGELFSNVSLDVNIFAEDSYPVRVPDVRIPANTQLDVQLTNSTAGILSEQIQLWGIKVNRADGES